mmetsp:Transcript_33195/g.60910  ORF Transcript_33195/g.60910 Transcript_33195/m.60910 type:complete len:292 (+) Transcript_33195:396-1271(+)
MINVGNTNVLPVVEDVAVIVPNLFRYFAASLHAVNSLTVELERGVGGHHGCRHRLCIECLFESIILSGGDVDVILDNGSRDRSAIVASARALTCDIGVVILRADSRFDFFFLEGGDHQSSLAPLLLEYITINQILLREVNHQSQIIRQPHIVRGYLHQSRLLRRSHGVILINSHGRLNRTNGRKGPTRPADSLVANGTHESHSVPILPFRFLAQFTLRGSLRTTAQTRIRSIRSFGFFLLFVEFQKVELFAREVGNGFVEVHPFAEFVVGHVGEFVVAHGEGRFSGVVRLN